MKSATFSSNIQKYKYPGIFYILSTLIPWLFWFCAGYISHLQPYQDKYLNIASVLSFIGLLAPVVVAAVLISKEPELRKDVSRRFFNFERSNMVYYMLLYKK